MGTFYDELKIVSSLKLNLTKTAFYIFIKTLFSMFIKMFSSWILVIFRFYYSWMTDTDKHIQFLMYHTN